MENLTFKAIRMFMIETLTKSSDLFFSKFNKPSFIFFFLQIQVFYDLILVVDYQFTLNFSLAFHGAQASRVSRHSSNKYGGKAHNIQIKTQHPG